MNYFFNACRAWQRFLPRNVRPAIREHVGLHRIFGTRLTVVLVPAATMVIFMTASSPAMALPDHCSSASRPVIDNRTGKVVRCIPLPKSTNVRKLKNVGVLRLRQKKRDQQALQKRQEINRKLIISRQKDLIKQRLTEQIQLNQRQRTILKRQTLERMQPAITNEQKLKFLRSDMPPPLSKRQQNLQRRQELDRRRAEMIQLQEALTRNKKLSRRQKILLKRIRDEQLKRR